MQVEVPAYSTTISITRYWLLAKLLLWTSRSEERGWSRHRTKASWPCAPANSGYHRLQEDSLRPLSLEDPPTTLSSFPFWPRVRFLLTDVRFFLSFRAAGPLALRFSSGTTRDLLASRLIGNRERRKEFQNETSPSALAGIFKGTWNNPLPRWPAVRWIVPSEV